MRGFTVEVPSYSESWLTGFQGAAVKTIRGKLYRVECWSSGWRLSIDGRYVRSWDDFGRAGQKLTHQFAAFLKSASVQSCE